MSTPTTTHDDLTREREANRVLAGRLQQARSELDAYKRLHAVLTTSRLNELLDASLEVHSWRRIMVSLTSGHSLQESIAHEHHLCEALSTSTQDQLTPSTGLWDYISSHLGVPLLPPSVAAPRRPSLLPPPTATTHAPFLPPLVDHTLIVGPGWGQTLRLFQSGPAPMASLTRPSAPLPPTSLHAFLTHGGAASYSSHSHTSSPSFNLTPEVLFSSSTPTGSPLPAEPHVLASFCLPEGALVKAVPLETLASKMYGALGMEGGGGESPISLDPLFERPSGGRKGPRGHFFFLTGSLGGGEEKEKEKEEEEKEMQKGEDSNGGLSGRPSESSPSSSSSSISIDEALGLKKGGSEKQQQGTRYCLCLAVSQVVTLGMVKAMAGGKGEGEGAEGGGSTITPEYALNLPRVFCVISRHPFFPAHFHYLKALASQWREGLEEQYRAWMGVGRMDVGGEWRAAAVGAAAAAAVVVAGSSAEVVATRSSNSATSSHLTDTSTAVVEASSSMESSGATSSSLSEEAGATPSLLSQRWKSLSKVGGGFWNSFSVAMSSASSSSSSSTAVTSLHLAEQHVRRSSIAGSSTSSSTSSSSSSSSSQVSGLDSSRLSPPLPPSRLSDREVSRLATHLSHSSRLCLPALNHLIHSYTSLLPPLPGEVLTWAPPLPSTTTTSSIAPAHGPVVLRYQRPPPTPPLHPNMDTPRCLAQWALPTLLSLLPPDSLLLLLGAALTEHSVVMVGGGVSYQALTAAVTALPLLLAPLHWTGLHLPLLTPSLHDVLSAPVPFCVGLPELPPPPPHSHQGVGWVQDEETLVVMLESETLRIPALPPPPAGVASSGGDGGLGGGDFLSILIPNASNLYEKLKPYFAVFSSPSSPTSSLATTTSGSGSYSSTASTTTTSSATPLQPPHLIRRPCYPPFTPSQESAVSGIVGVIEGHIEGLISASKGGTAKAEDFPEVEAPFWDRFLNSQALAHTLEARGVRKAAQAMLALGARVGGERAAVEAMAKGMGGGGAGNSTSTQALSHPPPLSLSIHASPPPTQHSSRPTAHHLPAVPPPRPPPLSFPGAGLGLPSIRSGGGSGDAVAVAAAVSAMVAAPSPRTARKIGAAWRAQGERAPVVRAVMAVRSTAKGRGEGEEGGREGSVVKEGEDEE